MSLKSLSAWFLAIVMLSACNETDEPTPVTDDPDVAINNWIYDVMDEVYYWTSTLPDQESLDNTIDPVEYFDDLQFSGDRFSFIVEDYQNLVNLLEGNSEEAGYEFTLFREGENNVIAVIRYVKRGSPADDAGLKRSDVITAINGTAMDLDNYQSVISQIDLSHTITYSRYSDDTGGYVDQGDLSLQPEFFAENPINFDTVYTIDNKKIGYFFYTFFQSGPDNTNLYDQQMDAIFENFKTEGVTEFVLDLRYNNGGGIVPTTNLASLIAPGVTTTDIFYENQWNDFYTNYINTLDNADDILRGKFYNKAENIGVNTVYILVSERSASASELMINGLLPYMNVEIIGTTTVGKNVGSIPIEDEENPDNDYGMLPIVLKVFNAAGQSDYDNGFTPSGQNFIDENQFAWYPVGDVRDPLLSRAIELITGTLPGAINDELSKLNTTGMSREAIKSDSEEGLPLIFDNPFR